MDPRLLQFYVQELAHVRDTGAEFAARFPKIASRLAMDSTEVHDPYVERLLEGFAFLAARVQLRLHEEFPRFTEQLLHRISPNFLAPVPAMGVVQLTPNLNDAALKKGVEVQAGTVLQSQVAKGVQTPCKFRTGHQLTLWPLSISSIQHGPFKGVPPRLTGLGAVRSALHITLEVAAQQPLSHVPFDSLDFHVSCGDEYAYTLFERVCHNKAALGIRVQGQSSWSFLPVDQIQALGFNDDEALLPSDSGQFSGMRLLQEFFSFPQRFLFFRIQGIRRLLAASGASAFELAICFTDTHPELDRVVDVDSLALNCTPVVNLFEQGCDRILLDEQSHEVHVQPNRSRPLDYEIHNILGIQGHGQNKVLSIPPLYALCDKPDETRPHFMFRRVPTQVSEKQRREGGRSTYTGTEVYLGLTLPTGEITRKHGLQQLAVRAMCTNRDLPLLMPVGQGPTDLAWPGNLPLKAIRFVRGPSRPKSPIHNGRYCWQLIEQLSINYLGLIDQGDPAAGAGAAALGQLLSLHADPAILAHQHIARALLRVESSPAVARIQRRGRPAVVRGLKVTLHIDELAMQGMGIAVLGQLIARYLSAHVSVNSFVQTTAKAQHSNTTIDFPAMSGSRPLL